MVCCCIIIISYSYSLLLYYNYIVFLWFVVVTLVELNWIDSLNIESSNCVDAERSKRCAKGIVRWLARSGGAAAAQKRVSPTKDEKYSSRFPEGVQNEEMQQ